MNFTELCPDQRYLFYYKNDENDEPVFRANFVKLFVHNNWQTLIVNAYESKKHPNESKKTWWSIDTNMILKVDTLPNIVGDSYLLPDDILLEIDNYY